MKKSLLYFIILFTGLTTGKSAFAQGRDSINFIKNIGLSLSGEIMHLDMAGLNRALRDHGLPALHAAPVPGITGTFYLGTETNEARFYEAICGGAFQEKEENGDYSSALFAGRMDVNLGYIAWHTERSNLSPLLGLGWMGYSLRLHNKSQIPSVFNDALNSFGGERHVQTEMNAYANLSLAYAWAINRRGDYFLGIHAGYRVGLNKKHWKNEEDQVLSGAPAISGSGWYAGIEFIVQ